MKFTDLAKPEAWQEFRSNGFLHLSNIIDPKKVVDLREEAYRVFHDTGSIARYAYRGKGRSGFTPPGVEGVADKRADYGRQFWDVHLDPESDATVCVHSRELERRMRHLTQELSTIMSGVFFYMDRGLGPLAHGLHSVMLKGNHGLRATHYPSTSPTVGGVLFPSHRDFSLVTVFVGGAEAGLQVDRSGEWHDLENPLGDITILAGGMLRYWTGGPSHIGRIGGVRHRVMRATTERLSFSFFTEPEPHTILPYSNGVTAGEYIDNFVTATRRPT
jgi:isopenicillin N synthase-like dioxygenase